MKTTIETKHFDHAIWIGKLKNYKNELVNLETQLQELASAGGKKEVLAKVEHFQNQFIVQKSNVNEILHAVKMDEKNERLERVLGEIPNSITIDSHRREWDRAETFEKIMVELKSDFEKFTSKLLHHSK